MVHLGKFSYLGKKSYEQKCRGEVFCAKFNILRAAFKCWSTLTDDKSFE